MFVIQVPIIAEFCASDSVKKKNLAMFNSVEIESSAGEDRIIQSEGLTREKSK